jgi:hypothetical protein
MFSWIQANRYFMDIGKQRDQSTGLAFKATGAKRSFSGMLLICGETLVYIHVV